MVQSTVNNLQTFIELNKTETYNKKSRKFQVYLTRTERVKFHNSIIKKEKQFRAFVRGTYSNALLLCHRVITTTIIGRK